MNLISMAQIYRKTVRINLKRKIICRVSILKRYLRQFWSTVIQCSSGKRRYRQLNRASMASSTLSHRGVHSSFVSEHPSSISTFLDDQDIHDHDDNSESDLVDLKISLLGDPDIGKTSFMVKYVGNNEKEEQEGHDMNKILYVEGARISYSIWEVGGDVNSKDRIPVVCKDSVAILIMFDLTSRCTLNSVIRWYQQARQWNQAAIPILIGTKFDDFIQLPIDLQWTIASQARTYAKALNATLFFSSAAYNINVNKIFKFLTAKLFDLPWTVERNLTVGEPIIDF